MKHEAGVRLKSDIFSLSLSRGKLKQVVSSTFRVDQLPWRHGICWNYCFTSGWTVDFARFASSHHKGWDILWVSKKVCKITWPSTWKASPSKQRPFQLQSSSGLYDQVLLLQELWISSLWPTEQAACFLSSCLVTLLLCPTSAPGSRSVQQWLVWTCLIYSINLLGPIPNCTHLFSSKEVSGATHLHSRWRSCHMTLKSGRKFNVTYCTNSKRSLKSTTTSFVFLKYILAVSDSA